MAYIAVAGGVNVDIGAHPFQRPRSKDSNPGIVQTSFGGVGRNIAHNLHLLGVDTELLTAVGIDSYAHALKKSCEALGIGITHTMRVPEIRTSTYVYITDEKGDMMLAVSDMEICDRLTPDYFRENMPVLEGAELVVADANLPAESLQFLAENLTVPLFVDPVSTTKSEKLTPILPHIHTLKPNAMEAEVLSGVSIIDRDTARRAARKLIERGVKRVFLSLGKDGILAAAEDETVWQPSIASKLRNDTGAGDALMAAVAWAWLQGEGLSRTAALGAAAAAIAAEGETTINPMLSEESVRSRAE